MSKVTETHALAQTFGRCVALMKLSLVSARCRAFDSSPNDCCYSKWIEVMMGIQDMLITLPSILLSMYFAHRFRMTE